MESHISILTGNGSISKGYGKAKVLTGIAPVAGNCLGYH